MTRNCGINNYKQICSPCEYLVLPDHVAEVFAAGREDHTNKDGD